jgi:predicted membrane-bound mannosyltransferase/DNA-binding beta-propeller fold protein YncE
MQLSLTHQLDQQSILDRPVLSTIELNWEKILFALIITLAIITRFYDLGTRVMSHDETSHVYFSWLLSRGQGYAHDPITHGPFQFHILALTYYLLGDSDFTARIPAAIFSIATVTFMWNYRRYLGRVGALVAAFLLTISPYMLYYGRYVRNEAFVGLWGVIMLWAILRYFETGTPRYLYWLTIVTVLHLASKETAYIYIAQALLFLGLYLIYRITMQVWLKSESRHYFLLALILAMILFSTAGTLIWASNRTVPPGVPGETSLGIPRVVPTIFIALGLVALVGAMYFLIKGYGWARIRQERSFDLAILLGTLILPQLSPFLINYIGWSIPVNANEVRNLTSTNIGQIAAILVPVSILSVIVGLWWNRRLWLINAGIYYAIFTVLYTTFFTNGAGFFTGLIGGLGYWLSQQAVNRGSQPWYYYVALQLPIYEYLMMIGSLLSIWLGLMHRKSNMNSQVLESSDLQSDDLFADQKTVYTQVPKLALLGFWILTSIFAYTLAGEKMPWLTVHITLPMILLSGWSFGRLIELIDWTGFRRRNGWIAILLIPVFISSLTAAIGSLMSPVPPFQGQNLEQLGATSTFLVGLIAALASGIGLAYSIKDWHAGQIGRVFGLTLIVFLAFLTMRTAFTAAYINYDRATEFLVYAHSGPGVKEALNQIEEISRRKTGDLELVVAFDNDTTYPYWWYLRNYNNQRYYAANPTRDLRDVPAILVGDQNYSKIEPIVGQAYDRFDYIRIWWPNQDYYGLTWERIWNALRDPNMRSAVFAIWLDRDYTKYAQITGKDFTLSNWYPSGRMRLYLRKDITAQLWDYGSTPAQEAIVADPYEGKEITLNSDLILGSIGQQAGQFHNPRDIAIASDGSFYVADTNNHRIQHFALDGQLLNSWGSFGDSSKGAVAGGMFYEPWGIAIGPDSSVYVADTWNHRIQKFTSDGTFVSMWGFFGTAETPFALWGPRDIAIDSQGRVYVTDTGNKRIVIFDANGGYVDQFGSTGFEAGQFNEPVGLGIDTQGNIYVADTWNQRIQVFSQNSTGEYEPLRMWDVVAWYGQSLDNKPYIAIDNNDHIFASDPEGYRILEFTSGGEFIRYWGDYGVETSNLNIPNGLAVDSNGRLWVADSGNHRILRFIIPENTEIGINP